MNPERERKPVSRSLWTGVVLAFLILITAWTAFIIIAVNNQPETVELEQPRD